MINKLPKIIHKNSDIVKGDGKVNDGDFSDASSLSKRIGYVSQLESIPMTFTVDFIARCTLEIEAIFKHSTLFRVLFCSFASSGDT
ncbi:hypothetical protein RO3G_16199 [Rhizopus delemar RA 99-880]|uniref:Uncharacterized protein n=1 Tax=Rhizopus delemar (strain RA 99-880 / ATCC MYA-4621 / FGSC 9543 / NRRL 43880) TaxID=246409 RepID=I1CSQ8_RHIO9|nr:hypothetical protein RO3G_16199 [Rhizopus delemar RA 99-880]|eukprot:EIE91488.1 hypothetical protein RO3G_16199 [Rhizopus delemar RA 99-880]